MWDIKNYLRIPSCGVTGPKTWEGYIMCRQADIAILGANIKIGLYALIPYKVSNLKPIQQWVYLL